MEYILTFTEGIISFISPCMLPMLPIYISYFACGEEEKGKIFSRVLAFVAGFTLVFCLLGLFAGTLGHFLASHHKTVELAAGIIIIIFGLAYMEVVPLPFFKGMQTSINAGSIISAFIFGTIFSVSLTPCVGAFLGSALMLASASGTAVKGGILLFFYSLGLGVPFLISALIIDRLKGLFGFIKRNYRIINIICGVFLIAVGLLMVFGFMGKIRAVFSF